MMRTTLYEAALVLLTRSGSRWSSLRAWGMAVAKRRGIQKAMGAVARKLSIVLHRMWRNRTDFRWSTAQTA
jgi:hypothetical protein